MNLAAWKYRRALAELGGPIERLTLREQETMPGVRGYEALAYLRADLRAPAESHTLYGNVDGTGSSRLRHAASHIAISEALERWAFYSTQNSNKARRFCFDLEPSTTGMAAFPGLFKRSAANAARREAIERWSVCHWWEGGMAARKIHLKRPDISGIELVTPWPEVSTVILWKRSHPSGFYAYGFATANDIPAAVAKASVEMSRNIAVLEAYFFTVVEKSPVAAITAIDLLQERRLLYFAEERGHAEFFARVRDSAALAESCPKKPRTLIDSEICGEWSKYATVWRCLFQSLSERHMEENRGYFLF